MESIGGKKYSLEKCTNAYRSVIMQMMMKPLKKADKPIHVSYEKEFGDLDGDMYYSVSLLNTKYEAPPKGKKAWYGANCPPGHYNANLDKHSRLFAVMGDDWTALVNADVVVDKTAQSASTEQLIAEILWEITFHGFSEKQAKQFLNKLKKSVKTLETTSSKKSK